MTDLDAIADEEAAKRKPGPDCWTCSIPEREWVDKAMREGRAMSVIAAVLIRQGHPEEKATRSRLESHKRSHVK